MLFSVSDYERNPFIEENWGKLEKKAKGFIEASEVILESGLFAGEAVQKAHQTEMKFLSDIAEKSVTATKSLLACDSPSDVVAAQTDFVVSLVEIGLNHMSTLSSLFSETNLKYVEAVDKNFVYINSRIKQACRISD